MKVLKFLDENLEKMLCVVFLALMSIIIVLQVFFRYVLNNSLSWSEELARYLFIWMIYVGISYGVKLDKHICVDAVYTFMPKGIKRGYAIVAYVLFLIFAVAIIYYGILVVGMQITSGQVSPAMGLPMQYVYVAPVVGMVLTVIRLVQKIYYAVTAKEWES
ncbi:MAG: TRAP transporter small permease [Dysosmobacter sp.]